MSSYDYVVRVLYDLLHKQYNIPTSLSTGGLHILPIVKALLVHPFNGVQGCARYGETIGECSIYNSTI